METGTSAHSRWPLPASLRAYLLRREALERLLRTGQLIAVGVAVGMGWAVFALVLDRLLGLGAALRACLLGIETLFLATILFLIIREIFHPVNFYRVAAAVEPAFDQRLETLLSQWAQPGSSPSSRRIIDELWRSVEKDLPQHPAGHSIRWRQLIPPWITAAAVICAASVLWMIPGMGLPRLISRLAHPRQEIAAVTTTQLDVYPGDIKVVEDAPLTIRVVARRLGQGPPVIHFSSDGIAFAKANLSPGDRAFIWNAPAVRKDFSYYVTGGDARSQLYHVTSLVPPAVSELRVRYEYPAYTHQRPLSVTTTTGPIEAPRGTHVQMDVVSLTPLSRARLHIGSQTLMGSATAQANVRHLDFTLDHDAMGQLDLVGANGVPGRREMLILLSAIPDQPPLAQLLQPSADIHLTPRDLMTIAWQALDDYGVQKILLQWRINNGAVHQIPLPASGDPRRCVGAVDVDLANMPLKIGDILAVSLLADDGAGHESQTPTRHIWISPRSVDIDTYLRLAALHEASDQSTTVLDELHASVAAWTHASQLNQHLAAAADAAALLRQAVLQAIQHTRDSQTVIAVANIGDRVAIISSAIEQTQIAPQGIDRLKQASNLAQAIQVELGLIAQGEQAAIVLADRANVREMSSTQQPDPQLRARMEETLARASAEAAEGATGLGISPKAADVDQQLEQRMRAGDQLVEAMKPVDLLAAAAQWAKEMADPNHAPRELAARLTMAAELEAARINGEAVWARDLLLAGRAAHRIEETALHDPIVSKTVLAKMIADYPEALQALDEDRTKGEASAAGALAQMKLWAAVPDLFGSTADVLDHPVAQDLAMEANARMAQHDYAGAAAIDAQLADTPQGRQARQNIVAAAEQMRTAERVDQVNNQQRALSAQTETPVHPGVLAKNQEQVAQRIEQVRQATDGLAPPQNSRDQAMAAILQAQQQLAAMPAGLGDAKQAKNARKRADEAGAMGDELDQFTPETADAVGAIREKLVPSLNRLDNAKDAPAVKAAADSVRASIAQVQHALGQTQQRFTEQDPLVAAKWYAEAAAAELSRQPPDLAAAHVQQSNLFRALHSAWVAAVHQASVERLAGSETISAQVAPTITQTMALPTRESSTASEPAGYSEALRMYFQRLNEDRDKQ